MGALAGGYEPTSRTGFSAVKAIFRLWQVQNNYRLRPKVSVLVVLKAQ